MYTTSCVPMCTPLIHYFQAASTGAVAAAAAPAAVRNAAAAAAAGNTAAIGMTAHRDARFSHRSQTQSVTVTVHIQSTELNRIKRIHTLKYNDGSG